MEVLVSHPGFTDCLENAFVERERSGVTGCSKVFRYDSGMVCSLLCYCCMSSFSIGTPVSLETTNSLLDLLCFYGDGEFTPEKEEEEKEDLEEPEV